MFFRRNIKRKKGEVILSKISMMTWFLVQKNLRMQIIMEEFFLIVYMG